MKKIRIAILCIAMVWPLTACSSSDSVEGAPIASDTELTSTDASVNADSSDSDLVEDPDAYEGAVFYSDLVDLLGEIPRPADGTQVGFTAKAYENEYWAAVKDGVEDLGEELQAMGIDITLDVRAAQGESDAQGQSALMSDMVNRNYDAIIASPISDGNLIQETERAQNAGIPVICSVGGFVPIMDVFVGPQHHMSGQLAAEWIYNQIGSDEECSVAVIMGMPQEAAARARTQGFQDWMADNAPNIRVIDPQNADWDRTKAKEVMDTLIMANDDLRGVYLNNDTMAMGALESVKSADKLGEILVVGNDGTQEALTSIRGGELSATVNIYPDFAGRISVDIALRLIAGQDVPKVIYQNQAVIDSTNVDLDPEEVFGWVPLQFAD